MTGSDLTPRYVPNPNSAQEDRDAGSDNPPLTDEELSQLRLGPEGLPPNWPLPSRAGTAS